MENFPKRETKHQFLGLSISSVTKILYQKNELAFGETDFGQKYGSENVGGLHIWIQRDALVKWEMRETSPPNNQIIYQTVTK